MYRLCTGGNPWVVLKIHLFLNCSETEFVPTMTWSSATVTLCFCDCLPHHCLLLSAWSSYRKRLRTDSNFFRKRTETLAPPPNISSPVSIITFHNGGYGGRRYFGLFPLSFFLHPSIHLYTSHTQQICAHSCTACRGGTLLLKLKKKKHKV